MLSRQTNKTVIIVCGPTAVGKTSVGIELAKNYDTEIISADSRQCFKELNIGVARPSEKELKTVVHHFIAPHSISEEINVSSFEKFTLTKAKEIFEKKNKLVLVGGTGLYIKAFCEGLDSIPPIPIEIRKKIIDEYEAKGLAWLQDEINKKDSTFFEKGEMQNPQRMMRALEVVEGTGKSILSFQSNQKLARDFSVIKIGLELPREQLYQNINNRVDEMLQAGLEAEVKSLIPFRNLNALQTVGYSEIFEYVDQKITLVQAVEKIKLNTRHYAKRQLTWFKRDKEINWFHPSQLSSIVDFLQNQ
ncbi:MAG: tRNA (adenosine(37)-N6)-dimethylallyltransferase MiaA [Chitinophagaceae bacterium]|nr:MAG: tRNA (adenosine(37)-N6)-dimethylallyltransferase MiaA [Chitinophagaceae bacterium]